MILSDTLKEKLIELEDMGFYEATSFKQKVINSLLDNPTKHFVIDKIDNRINRMNLDNAFAVYDEEITLGD